MRPARAGFTLIELVVVIVIAAVLAVATGVSISSSLSATKLHAARWKLKNDIRYAQLLAVTQQVNHQIVFTPATNSYTLYRSATPSPVVVRNPATGKPFTVSFNSDPAYGGVILAAPSFGTTLAFDALGTPSDGTSPLASDGTLTLSYGGAAATITITKNTGKVS